MCHDFNCSHDQVASVFLQVASVFLHFVRQFWSPWPNHQLVWLSDKTVTCFVRQRLAGDAQHEKNTWLRRVLISPNLSGKILAKSDCAVQLWCLLMGTAIGKVNDGPYYCAKELVVRLCSIFNLSKAPRSAVSTLICLCKTFCACC